MLLLLVASAWPVAMSVVDSQQIRNWGISEQTLAKILTEPIQQQQFPTELRIPGLAIETPLTVNYTLDSDLQAEAQRLLKKYNPDYGVFVAINPDNGHILAMTDSSRNGENWGNMALLNTFPAASISKIITAVATVNEGQATTSTVIPFNGKTTSLYKTHVFKHQDNQWTRNYTLNESFAKSVNSVFGRLGAVNLGAETMIDYAYRLGFNGRFASDIEFDNGKIEIDPKDPWQAAEMASGYTTRNTLSPLHATVLAASAVNGGNLVAPVIVNSLVGQYGIPIYIHETPGLSKAMSPDSSLQLKQMMQSTVKIGSAKSTFRGFHKNEFKEVIVGGKTGSLTGFKPKGKYDWFVGFAEKNGQKIAFAALCINKEKWYVKSTRLAREILEFYYAENNTVETG